MFASKGRRLLLLGGIAVVALAGASVLLMNGNESDGPQANARVTGASEATPAAETAKATPAKTSVPSSPGQGANGKVAGETPPTTAPKVPAKDATPNESVFQRSTYTYRSLGRVDPFESLIKPQDGASRLFAEKLDPEMLQLVGVLTNGGERRALVEDDYGFGYVLKEGDRVLRGRVISIGEETMRIRHTLYGVTETTTLSLVQKSQGRGLPNDRLR